MERHYFGLSTLLASVALLIWSIGETFAYPQGPNVSLGSNPVVTLHCGNNQYAVPSGYDYIITDILIGYGSGNTTNISVNGNVIFSDYRYGTAVGGQPYLQTGLKISSTSTVSCSSNGNSIISGYLAHQ